MTARAVHYWANRAYLSVTISHFGIDILNNGRNVLVAWLALSLGLTNEQVGIVSVLYNVGNAVMQPLFGWLADKFGPRWLIIWGTAWMIAFYTAASLAGDWIALGAVTLAGIGSGAFHPSATLVASQTSVEERGQATAVFFMAGQLGLFVGPVIMAMLLDAYDRPGLVVLPLAMLLALGSSWQWVGNRYSFSAGRAAQRVVKQAGQAAAHATPGFIILLSVIIVTVNTVSITALTFVPKLFSELNYSGAFVGWAAGLYMLGSAMGGVFGGHLADRIDGKWPMFLGVVLAIAPLYYYIPAGGALSLLLLTIGGFFGGMPHSILVLLVQALLPDRKALASGLALGFMFFSGALGSYVVGIVADQIGLGAALQGTAWLMGVAAVAVLALPNVRNVLRSG